jgi:hypothetical protein
MRRSQWFWTHAKRGAPIVAERCGDGWALYQGNRLLCHVASFEVARKVASEMAARSEEETAQ